MYFNSKGLKVSWWIDKFLSFFYSLKRSTSNTYENDFNYKKVLILHSHLIGDVIMSIPACRAIREKFPDCELIFWGNKWGYELLYDQKLFDSFFIACIPWSVYDYSLKNLGHLFSQIRKLRRLKIDLALDFRGDMRNIFLLYLIAASRRVGYNFTGGSYWLTDIVQPAQSIHIIDRNLNVARYIGAKNCQAVVPKINPSQEKVDKAREYFEKIGLKNIAFLHAGASQPKRLWPAERFAQVADFLYEKGYCPVLLSDPSDKILTQTVKDKCKSSLHILSTVELEDIPAYLNCGKLFIGLDSGIAHIAAALGKNIIVLFGPQDPNISSPRGDGLVQTIAKGDFQCRPCYSSVCNLGNACMKAIRVGDVIEAIEKIEKYTG